MKKRIDQAFAKAGHDTAQFLSAHLQAEAHNSGWPSHVVKSLKVSHEKGSFSASVHDDHLAEALDWEYGTPDHRPTAAVRRTANNTREAEKFFASRFMKHVGIK